MNLKLIIIKLLGVIESRYHNEQYMFVYWYDIDRGIIVDHYHDMLKINKKRLTLQHQQCFYFGFALYSKKIICIWP